MKETGRLSVPALKAWKQAGARLVALTAYDAMTASLLGEAEVDLILVGDSLGMVKMGYSSTLPVTIDDIEYHTRLVARGLGAKPRALLVADMPFMTYQAADADAVRAAGRLLKAGAAAVKLEGGRAMARRVRALTEAQIPVVGHLGMTPQSVHVFGGYKVQGRKPKEAQTLLSDARALQAAGACAIVLECVPMTLAARLTRSLRIPTIGIGAGAGCDGQILVIDDLLGWTAPPYPKFVQTYADLRSSAIDAVRRWSADVRQGRFPDDEHAYR